MRWLISGILLGIALFIGILIGLDFLFIAAEIEGREGMP